MKSGLALQTNLKQWQAFWSLSVPSWPRSSPSSSCSSLSGSHVGQVWKDFRKIPGIDSSSRPRRRRWLQEHSWRAWCRLRRNIGQQDAAGGRFLHLRQKMIYLENGRTLLKFRTEKTNFALIIFPVHYFLHPNSKGYGFESQCLILRVEYKVKILAA